MKQRYTITIADMEVNVVSDGSPEAVESLVGIVDRKMREILLANRRCSKSQAALLCALDYCSDKLDALRKVKQLEAALDTKETGLRAAEKELTARQEEIERLTLELATMRESLLAAKAQKNESALTAPASEEEAPAEAAAAENTEASVSDPALPVDPDQVTLSEVEGEVAATEIIIPVAEQPYEEIAPEDVDFDPTEVFRRAKANRGARKGKRKI